MIAETRGSAEYSVDTARYSVYTLHYKNKWEVKPMGLKIEREAFVNKTFRLNVKLASEVETVCKQRGITMNRFVDIALRYALEHLEDEETPAGAEE